MKLLVIATLVLMSFASVHSPNVSFNEFTVYSKGDFVSIQWRSNKHGKDLKLNHCIQKSSNGKDFKTMLCVYDQGNIPDIKEFIETDYAPLSGWSYYRILTLEEAEIVNTTHIAPVFFGVDRVQKGQILIPNSIEKNEVELLDLSTFDNAEYIFVLRNGNGVEYFVKSSFRVESNKIFLNQTEQIPEGPYRVASCSNDGFNGVSVNVVK